MIKRGAKLNPAVRLFRVVWILLVALLAGNAAAGWYDPGWPYRQKITILPTLTDSTLNGFPYMVKITDAANPVFARAQPDGDDLLFTDSTGVFKLNHEIEKYDNSTKELFVWVNVPSISATGNTVIYLYYGHGSASNQENVPDTWDDDFVMVQHLEETSGTHFDSAGANNGTPLGSLNQNVTGRVDGADLFDGMDDYIDIADDATLRVVEMTLEAWVYMPGSIPSGFRGIVEHATDTANWYGLWKTDSSDAFHFRWSTGSVRRTDFNGTIVADTWYYVVGVLDPGEAEARTYLNGSPDKAVPDPSLPTPTSGATQIGLGGDATPEWFDGTIDEVRISKIARTEDWIEATFRNLDDPATFESLEPEQQAASITTLSGIVYEDINGDSGLGDAVGVAGVRVRLYSDLNDDGVLDAGDAFVEEASTNATGDYSFDVDTGTTGTKYLVAVDSKTVPPNGASPFNGGFTQADVWAEQTYGDDPATPSLDLGPRMGGLAPGTSDDVDPLSTLPADNEYQHLARDDLSGGDVSGVHFALSFRAVSHTADRDDDLAASRTAQGSLRQGVQNANAIAGAATLGVPSGTFVLGLTGAGEDSAGTGDLDVTDDLTVQGQDSAATVIDGNSSDRVLDVFTGVTAEVRDLTIRDGDESIGGGVRNAGSLTVRDGMLTANDATEGGAIHNQGSPASLTLDNLVLSGNTATDGAGIFSLDSTSSFSLTDVTLSGNTASGNGGGIYASESIGTVTASTISGNAANNNKGGGIYLDGNSASLDLSNATISANTATSEGGGIFADGDTLSLTHVTVNGNSAGSKGGGIRRKSGTVTLQSTIVSNNTGGNCEDTIISAGYNLDSADTCGFSGPGDQIDADPKLGPLADNGGATFTHAVLPGSDAIDAVLAGCPPPGTDQRGVARPLGVRCETGAFEAAAYTLSGTVFEDLVGDVLNDGAIGDALNPARSGVDVFLYEDTNSNGLPDVGEPLVSGPTNPVTTDGSGAYSFGGLSSGDYLVVVDSRDFDPTQPSVASPVHWAEQTYGPAGGQCADWVSDTVKRVTAGPCYGGRRGAIFDDLASGVENSEHVAAVTVGAANVADVDFGFSFNVVTNLGGGRDGLWSVYTGQGTIDMFLRNATAITVPNTMRFVPAVPANMTGPVFGGEWWRIDVDGFSSLFQVDDPDTTLDGTAHDPADGATVLDTNPGFMGASAAGGLTVGLDAIALPQVERPELELRGRISVWHDGHRAIIQDMAFTEGTSLISVYTAGEVRIRRNVLGSEPDDFVQPAGTSTSGVNIKDGGFDGFVEDNLIGFCSNGVQLGTTTKVATSWQITGNEIRDCTDGVEVWQLSPDNTVQGNLLAGNWRGVHDRAGSNAVTSNTITASKMHGVILAGGSTPVTRNIIDNGLDPDDGDPVNGVLVVGDETPGYANSPARLNRISDNRFGGNSWISIDLAASGTLTTGDGVTPNDGGTDATHGHNGLDHPVITSADLSGGTATIAGTTCSGCTVEIYRAVADGDGSDTYLGDDYGEGIARVAMTTADAAGDFSVGGVGGLSPGDSVSAIAFTTAAGPADTSEFGPNFPLLQLTIVKRAFQLDGTAIANGSTLPKGMLVKFMLYIDNPGGDVADATLQDVLDPVFAYQTSSMKMDNTLLSSVVCPGGVCDEAAIFTQVDDSGVALGDGDADADIGSYSAGTRTIDLGDGNNSNNAQLDLAADRVWAVVFTSRMQ